MLSRLWAWLGGGAVRITGTAKLPEGHARRVSIGDPLAGGTEIVLARVAGRLCALDRRCPHEGGRITDGPLVEGKFVVCPLHNYKFDPRTGKAIGVACADAKTYRVREVGEDADVFGAR
jgi:nitrite reductase/ring-hydroxylating ferredoxin subunit